MMNVITNPPITQSMDTFTVGRELLSLSYVMGGIEKSCLQHKYSFPVALTARRNCKKISNIFHKVGNMRSRKVHHHFLHSDHSQTKKNNKNKIFKKW